MRPKNILKNKQKLAEASVGAFAVGSVCLWATLLGLSTIFFLLKLPLSGIHFLVSIFVTLLFLFWYTTKTSKNALYSLLIALGLFIATFIPSLIITGNIIDISYDGQAYHQEAVIQLSRGWNPIYMMLENEATANLERWLNHYPKGVWYFAASIYDLTGNIEMGKVLSFFAPIVAFAFGIWGMVKISINKFLKIAVILALVLNPVVIYQSLSYYIDGVLVSMLLALAFVAVRIASTKDRSAFFPFLFLVIILMNIKLSSVVFAGILIGAIVMYFWTKDALRLSLSTIKFSAMGIVLGVLVIGYNPYVTNFVIKGHPLYPSMGKEAYDYVPGNTPENYWKLTPPVRLFKSIFATTSLVRGEGQNAQTKIPFTVIPSELEALGQTNAKTGGFGPWFGGIFLIAVVAGFCYVVFALAIRRKYVFLASALSILGTAALVDTSSVARYVPYVWWLPGVVALYLFIERKGLANVVGIVLVVLMLVNGAISAFAYYPYNLAESAKVKKSLTELASEQGRKPIVIDVLQFGSTKVKLKNYGIEFLEVPPNTVCKKRSKLLPQNITEVCEL